MEFVDFVFVSEVRYYLRIDKSLLCQIRENPPHIRVGFGQLKRFHNRGGRLTRNSIHGLRGTMTAKQFDHGILKRKTKELLQKFDCVTAALIFVIVPLAAADSNAVMRSAPVRVDATAATAEILNKVGIIRTI